MSPPSPARGRAGAIAREVWRTMVVQVWSGMAAWRWALVVLAFAAGGLLIVDKLQSAFFTLEIPRQIDAWDLYPGLATDFRLEFGLLGFGFLLFVVDTYQRGREQGIVAMALARMRFRSLYWLATMGAVGAMAVAYVVTGFVVTFLIGMVLCPPASAWPMLPRQGMPAMYPSWSIPLPLYTLLLIAYTSWALWITGCVAVLVSLLGRRKVVALGFVMLWPVLSISTSYLLDYIGVYRLLNLGYLIGMFKHYIKNPFSVGLFFAVTAVAWVVIAVVGAWRLRREEL